MKLIHCVLLVLFPFALTAPLPASYSLEFKRQTALNSFIAAVLKHIPAINGPIEKVSGLLTAFTHTLSIITWQQTKYNDNSCKDYTLIFARGTTEPGNVGILVGPPLIEALKDRVGEDRLAVQGVNGYEANVEGYLAGGSVAGSSSMARQIEATKARCPNTKLLISGYSQGAMLIHKAVTLVSEPTAAWISKVIMFGDPFSLKQLPKIAPSKVKVYCNVGDAICINGALILPPHLTYAINAWGAAEFAIAK